MLPIEIIEFFESHKYLSNTTEFKHGTPSDAIIFKTLPGLGATHGEILLYKWRNSIIIEPNVPVIRGKQNELDQQNMKVYPDMLAVYGRKKKEQVISYLKSSIMPKKIVCTPEAYLSKVRPAIEECSDFSLFNDFFMLLDECDKLTTENSYRARIVAPMDDFFKFKNKAMISATALIPSDIRFKQNGFKILKVAPQYKYPNRLNLISTNNVTCTLYDLIKNSNEQWFIFLNSTDLIYSIIKALKIENDSRVFCAEESVRKLMKMGFKCASDTLGEIKKFSFLTSRFFSAVDIKLNSKPNVVMITNVYRAQHSIIDPYSDAIQIFGRLRNGINAIGHITNYNYGIKWLDEKTALEDINDAFTEYTRLVDMAKTITTSGGKKMLNQAIERVDINKFVDDENKLMPYMVDNHLLEQKVKRLYQQKSNLYEAYKKANFFTIAEKESKYQITDSQLLSLELADGKANIIKVVADILYSIEIDDGRLTFYFGDDLNDIYSKYPEVVVPYKALGYNIFKSLDFNKAKINRAYKKHLKDKELQNPEMVREIKTWYTTLDVPKDKEVKDLFRKVYKDYGVTKSASSSDILQYYDAKKTTNKMNEHVWKILGVKK